jgi:hypothetical protein
MLKLSSLQDITKTMENSYIATIICLTYAYFSLGQIFLEQIKLVKSYKKILYHTKEYHPPPQHPHPESLVLTRNTLTHYILVLILNTLTYYIPTLILNTLTLIQSVGSSISLFEVHITFGFKSC